jgi:hypothetical protein
MGVHSGPNAAQSGLLLSYDMGNTEKSWMGAPTTNLMSNPLPSSATGYGVSGGGGTLTYDGGNEAIKWVRDTYSSWGAYTTASPVFNGNLSTSLSYSISFEWKTENTASINDSVYSYNFVQGNGQDAAFWSANLLSNSTLQKNGWYLFKITYVPENTGINAAHRVFLPDQGANISTFYWRKIQFEQQTFATPFVSGTRSNTQAILDLTGDNVLTADSLVYETNGSFAFIQPGRRILTNVSTATLGTSFTVVAVFVKTGNGSEGSVTNRLFSSDTTNASTKWCLGLNNAGNLLFAGSAGTENQPTFSVPLNEPVFAALRYNTSNYWLNINGVDVLSNQSLSLPVANFGNLAIGGRPNNTDRSWIGTIPVAQVYNRVLSLEEVQRTFNALRSRFGT